MQHPYPLATHAAPARPATVAAHLFLLLLALLLPWAARAQAPAWSAATIGSSAQTNGTSQTLATAVDASGNVFVTGSFSGQVAFGSTVLSSVGSQDLFVAKYVPATATWAWAQSGGGTGLDQGFGIAVSGASVYVTGNITNSTTNASGVLFGGTGPTTGTVQVNGASATSSSDLVVVKYTDNGTTATLGWTQVGGGTGLDQGRGIAVSGASVYVTGIMQNSTANASRVLFGGTGTTAGTVQVNGASATNSSDLVVVKYTDNGATATLGWTQVGGGTSNDLGYGIAVSGASVYVTGIIINTTANASRVLFGGTGTTAGTVQVNGASATNSSDLVVVKYTDNGSTATLGWTQVGGGIGTDQGRGIAVSGANVYVTGYIINTTTNANGVLFGGTGTTPGTVQVNGASTTSYSDLVVAKYTDNGATATLGWTQVGGGTNTDVGLGIAVSGASVYVTGNIANTTANANGVLFGGTGTTAGTVQVNGASATSSSDLVVVKYTDNGSTATLGWTQVGGGIGTDQGRGIAVSGANVYVTGYIINTTTNANGVLFGGTGTTPGTVQVNGASTTSYSDLVVAKYTDNGATATLGWTQVGGGTSTDVGLGIAVSGASVYVTGNIANTTANANGVLFGGTGTTAGTVQVNGASATSSQDLVVAKYTDNGATATLGWTQVGGGSGADLGFGIAVSGPSVYVTGYIFPGATFGSFTIDNPVGVTQSFLGELLDAKPLPVELTAFTAMPDGPQAVRLAWTTATEVNSAAFGVERSLDGVTFRTVGTVPAAGTSNAPRAYTLLDQQLPAGVPVLYYRLRQVDQDGTFSYSPVRSVALRNAAPTRLTLAPNPTTGAATLRGAAAHAPVQLYDAVGRLVLTTTADATGTARLVLPAGQPRGVYVVRSGTQATRLVLE